MEKYGAAREATDDNIIRRTRFACWIRKARRARARTHEHIHTLRICNTNCFSTATIVTRTRHGIAS